MKSWSGVIFAAWAQLSTAASAAPPIEIVIANEALSAGGKHMAANVEAFAKRMAQVGGWPKDALTGRAFARPRDGLAYLRKTKTAAFAILPLHQFLEGRKDLRFEVLGRAVGLEGRTCGYWGIARNEPRAYEHVEFQPGLRLALTEPYDLQWLRVLFDNNVRPGAHFKLVEVPSGQEAIAAVLAKRADVALVYETDFAAVRHRIDNKVDLAWVYASLAMPPPAVVAVGGRASAVDRKRMVKALGQLCKKDGAPACGRMAILYAEAGGAESYQPFIQKYETFR